MRLKRQETSDAVSNLGWRLIRGELRSQVRTTSLAQAAEVATRAAAAADDDLTAGDAGAHLRLDLRDDRVYLSAFTQAEDWVTALDIELARAISGAVSELGLVTEPEIGRAVQLVEIGIDAMDIPAIRPFWKAVLGYADVPGSTDPEDAILDRAGQGPAIWFQQMDAPRPQRNRVHLDINVPHDEAQRRLDAAVAAGGTLTYTDEAPAFWVLADPEGNEACICTWQARD
ncbi:MAG TPA: VOC family protein [Streptosporangiaceae bacterium]|nr:VOC family protein [Streptosporangiaceae bacterium]